jgi:hypothetical protein
MSRSLAIVILAALLAGCGPYDPKSAGDLSKCYAAEFGAPPPSGITVLKGRQMVIRDWGAQWLQLHADTNLIDSVILKSFTRQGTAPSGFSSPKDRYTPDWWMLPPSEELEFYTCNHWTRGTFRSSCAGIAVHRASAMIYFRCDRVD